MPRAVRDARIETRSARAKLKQAAKPYWRAIDPGLHIGYRKGKRGGRWVLRAYAGDQQYVTETLGTADDNADADGHTVLDFRTAQALARERAAELAAQSSGRKLGPYTVGDALDDYEKEQVRPHGRGTGPRETRRIIDAELRPVFADTEVAKLTSADIRAWMDEAAARPPRTRSGKPRQVDMDDPEIQRARRDSVNRALRTLKAALNHAYREGRVASDAEWRRVKAFHATSSARPRWLTLEEVRRLLNACPPAFRQLVRGALLTGARPGDLKRLTCGDFVPERGALIFANRKTGKPYTCHLSDEGVKFFTDLTAGKPNDALMFTREDGSPWADDDHRRPMVEASKAAKLNPPATLYTMRHTYASHAIMSGVPMLVVAHNVGHRDTRMLEAHYGHLADSHKADAIRAGLPNWGGESESNVVPLTGAK